MLAEIKRYSKKSILALKRQDPEPQPKPQPKGEPDPDPDEPLTRGEEDFKMRFRAK